MAYMFNLRTSDGRWLWTVMYFSHTAGTCP